MKTDGVKLVLVTLIVVCLGCIGVAGMILVADTIVDTLWYTVIIALVSLVAGAIVASRMEGLTELSNRFANFGIAAVGIFILLFAGVAAVNYSTAEFDVLGERASVTVTRKFTETKHHTYRNGRHGYTRGAPYKVYCLELDLPTVGERKFETFKSNYDQVSTGDTVTIGISRGCLGMRVVNSASIRPLHPRKPKLRRRCRFFGTTPD